jgi:DNA adenine methylase
MKSLIRTTTTSRKENPARSPLVQPFLKWVGGKRQLLPEIRKYIPPSFNSYYEPFVGGGAVLFGLQPARARINDTNAELINLYDIIRRAPDELMEALRQHRHSEDYYYELRALDREADYHARPAIERAARILFLNKTCYNGLFRVNAQGHFNVPFGDYANPGIIDPAVLQAVSNYLNTAEVTMTSLDFEQALACAVEGDFAYLDPPYDPVSDTSSFTGYNVGNFGREDQRRLKKACDGLAERGCSFLLSNSATDFIRELYAGYEIIEVAAARNINAVAAGRGKVSELLIRNKV